ncbi:MAG: type VI secretion system tip protein VgrG [bacterium]
MAFASKITIEIAGNKIPDFLHVAIDQHFNQPHTFQLVCRRDTFEQTGDSPLTSSINKIGSVITFLIEGINSGIDTKDFFFKGIITGVSASESLSNQEIIFSGQSPDILLHGYPSCRSFENMSLKQIVQEVLSPYPADQITLKCDPANTHQYPYIVQYKETNYEFLRRLAARFGEWFFYDGRGLVFGSFPKTSMKGVLGINLMNFSVGTRMAPLNFNYVSYLYGNDQREFEKSSSYDVTGSLNNLGKKTHDQSASSFADQSTYYFPGTYLQENGTFLQSTNSQDVVEKEKLKVASGMVFVNGSSYEPMKPGNVLQIKSFNVETNGEIDAGEYLVTGINHSIDISMNYQNIFTAIPAESKVAPKTGATSATRCESQSAVVKDRDDPMKIGRVRVNFSWQESNQMSPWIRVSQQDAGKNKGIFSVPDLEDEVLVGFEGGDAEKPFVMGSFHNSTATPSDPNLDLKDVIYLRTPKQSSIILDERKGKRRIALFMEDGRDLYGIEINIEKKYILVQSPKDIHILGKNITINATEELKIIAGKKFSAVNNGGEMILKASKNIQINGNGGVNINGDTSISGSKVSIKADAEIKAEAPSVSLDGSALTEIKGGIVKIN